MYLLINTEIHFSWQFIFVSKVLFFIFICYYFKGLNLLDVIDDLRNEDDEELIIQCNVFDDEKQDDDESFNAQNPVGVDINDHNAVFNALYEKVKDFFFTLLFGIRRLTVR